jgi:hypothetical protein
LDPCSTPPDLVETCCKNQTWIITARQCLHEEQHFSFSGCMTAQTRRSQICISIVLMMEDIVEDECNRHIASLITARSLFDGLDDVPNPAFEKGLGEHKKN